MYRKNAYAVASAVILWPGVLASFARSVQFVMYSPFLVSTDSSMCSTYIMWKSLQHNDKFGPFSSKYKNTGEEASLELPSTDKPKATVPENNDPITPTQHTSTSQRPAPYPGT